MAKMAHSR